MLHGSPQTTTKYGKSAPMFGCIPNISCCSFTCGGDCEAIEHNMSWTESSIRLQRYKFYLIKVFVDVEKCIVSEIINSKNDGLPIIFCTSV